MSTSANVVSLGIDVDTDVADDWKRSSDVDGTSPHDIDIDTTYEQCNETSLDAGSKMPSQINGMTDGTDGKGPTRQMSDNSDDGIALERDEMSASAPESSSSGNDSPNDFDRIPVVSYFGIFIL